MTARVCMTLQQIAELPDNSECADCRAPNPNWTSINLGTFICINCAGIHRNLGVHISKVRSINLDTSCWDPQLIDFMLLMGNKKSRDIYEKYVPNWYMRPLHPLASDVIRDNWIRAKYYRKEFQECWIPNKISQHLVSGYLTKQSAVHTNRNHSRYFVLFGSYLIYFKKASSSFPSGEIDLSSNVEIVVPGRYSPDHFEDVRGRHHFNLLLQVITPERTYSLIAPDAKSLLLWAHSLNQATFMDTAGAIQTSFVPAAFVELNFLPNTVLHTGILSKQGGKRENWRRRYFVLCSEIQPRLLYFKGRPESSTSADGGVRLSGAFLSQESVSGRDHTFSIITRTRRYFFEASNHKDRDDWMKAIQYAISYHDRSEKNQLR